MSLTFINIAINIDFVRTNTRATLKGPGSSGLWINKNNKEVSAGGWVLPEGNAALQHVGTAVQRESVSTAAHRELPDTITLWAGQDDSEMGKWVS